MATDSPDESLTQEVTADTTEIMAPTETPAAPTDPPAVPTEVPAEVPTEVPAASTETPDAAAPEAPIADTWIKSDLADYFPGSLVTLSGGGWTGDSEVLLTIDDISNPTQTWNLTDSIPVQADGTIVYQFSLPAWFVALYQVKAAGVITGRTVETTFTDCLPGALEVTKCIVLGSVVGTPTIPNFSITIYGPKYPLGNTKVFNSVNGLKQTWNNLLPGLYIITEAGAGAMWSATYSSCLVAVCEGKTAKETVTNTYVPGSLEVTKSVVRGAVVGSPAIPDFLITITGPSYPGGNTKVFNYPDHLKKTWTNLIPGDYTITEADAGTMWTETVPASAVTVSACGTAKATVTNTYVPGSLEVTKSVVLGSVVGTPAIPDFSITIKGPSYPGGDTKVFKYPDKLTKTWTNLIPGDYTITEAGAGTSWTETVPAGPVTVAAGGTAKAAVTNTYVPGALEVTKHIVLGDLAGTPVIPDFSIKITGPSYPTGDTKAFSALLGLTQTWYNLLPGDYTITEVSSGIMWIQTVPAMAVTVAAGQTAKADVTNTYVPGALEVAKVIELGDVVGTPVIPDFSITITGPSCPTGDTKVFNTVNGLTQTWTNLIPGDYTITEDSAGSVWSETVPAGAVTVAAGATAAASVTNTYVPGALEVTKVIELGDVIGTPVIPDFSITITGPSYPTGDTKVFNTVNGLTQTWTNLIPGDYTITELSTGMMWSQTVPAGAVTVAAGQTATAGVTNTYVPGALAVTKVIDLADVVGLLSIPDFSITITGPSYPTGDTKVFNALLGLTQTWSNLIPGDYTITEAGAGAAWTQTVPAGAVTVAAGATAAASVTNTYVPGALKVTKSIVLGTVAGTPAIPDFSITITGPSYPTGSTKVFNTANGLTQTWTNLIPGDYTITEAAAGTTWTQAVPAGAVTVAAGQTATAGVTNTYVPGALAVTKSIVLVDVTGTPVIPDFSITITGPSYPSGSTKVFNSANGLTQTWSNLIPGAYTITEAVPGGNWKQTVPTGAVTVAAGATAAATVTNTLTEVLGVKRDPTPTPTVTPTPTTAVLGAAKTGESDNLMLIGGVSLLLLAGILIVLRRKWDDTTK